MATLGETASTATFLTPVLVATLASNVSTASTHTTPVNLTGLSWSYVASSVYIFRFVGTVTPGASSTGICITLDVGTVTQVATIHINPTATGSVGWSIADDTQGGATVGFPAASETTVAGWGILRTAGGQSGTAQLRVRAEVDSIITVNAGFTLIVEKVS